MLKKNKISLRISVILIHLYLLLTVASPIFFINTDSFRLFILFILILISIILLKNVISLRIRKDLLYVIGYLLVLVLFMIFNSKLSLDNIRNYLFFPFTYLLFSLGYTGINENDHNFVIKLSSFVLLIYSAIFLYGFFNTGISPGNIVNNVYYIVFLTPFLFYLKNVKVKLFLALLVATTIVISGKRAAMLVFIFYVIFISFNTLKSKKHFLSNVFHLSILILLIVSVGFFVNNITGFNVLDRLLNIFNDGGSGRLELYQFYIGNIKDLSILEIMFGNGMNPTSSITDLQSAHADLLEVFYRIGFIGFVIYIGVFVNLLFLNRSASNPKILVIMIFVTLTLFSQLIFVPSYVGYLGLLLAMFNSNFYRKKMKYEK